MITLDGAYKSFDDTRLFNAINSDITSGLHLPTDKGTMKCNRIKLKNGDKILIMDTSTVLIYDLENKTWYEL